MSGDPPPLPPPGWYPTPDSSGPRYWDGEHWVAQSAHEGVSPSKRRYRPLVIGVVALAFVVAAVIFFVSRPSPEERARSLAAEACSVLEAANATDESDVSTMTRDEYVALTAVIYGPQIERLAKAAALDDNWQGLYEAVADMEPQVALARGQVWDMENGDRLSGELSAFERLLSVAATVETECRKATSEG